VQRHLKKRLRALVEWKDRLASPRSELRSEGSAQKQIDELQLTLESVLEQRVGDRHVPRLLDGDGQGGLAGRL
jgi:hypothetical protein